ncbi:carboxypeptidase-like regulatory domain-containing protein [Myxococcota bacterium]|nr:carboxypeptidase-like regulatory domain-containing protein [Myxococcota bacterium]
MTSRALTLALFAFAACGEKDELEPATDSGSVEGDADADTDSDSDTDTEEGIPADATMTGKVVDESGKAIEGARVSMCKTLCRTSFTDASGAYSFPALEGFTHSFEIVISSGGWATPLAPITLVAAQENVLDAVGVKFSDSQAMPATPKEVEVVEGLYITVGADQIKLPFGADGSMVSGVRVAAASQLPVELTGEVIQTWYLGPFDGHAIDAHLPFRMDNLWGLTAGETLEVWAADYALAAWVSAGTVTVSADGLTLESDGEGIPVLSTLVLLRPGA